MKNLFYIFMLSVFFVSCKTLQKKQSIVTTKKDAVKTGSYSYAEKTELNKAPKPTRKEQRAIDKAKEIAFNDSIEKSKIKTVVEQDTPQDFTPTFEVGDYIKEQILNVAKEGLGSPYKSGGTSTSGFDCSGFVLYAMKPFDIELPRSSAEMARTGKRIYKKDAKPGDLIFFNTTGGGVSHVGIVTGVEGDVIKFIHSSSSNGVSNSSTAEGYYARTFVGINRVLE